MRQRKASLVRRVNGDLHLQFSDEKLTSYAGLELFARHLRALGFHRRLHEAFQGIAFRGDYPWISIIRLFLAMFWIGARRLRHVRFLSRDPMVRRFTGLQKLPEERTLSRWLRQFSSKLLAGFERVNLDLVIDRLHLLALPRLTIDPDGSVISTGLKVAWAFRGFNPHHRKEHSYYPILAHLAQTGQILALKNRPGNVHDSRGAAEIIRKLFQAIRLKLGCRLRIEFRLDGAFFQRDVIETLQGLDCNYAVKVPMWKWLDLRPLIQMRTKWDRVNSEVSAFETRLAIPQWNLGLRVVCYRKKVFHPTPRNYQLDLFSPDDGTYEYSAVATDLDLAPKALWYFMAGRGAQEKTLAELKDGLAFDTVPTNHYGANSAWQWISVLAHNLYRDFQLAIGAEKRVRSRKRTYLYLFETIQTARFEWLNVAARVLHLAQGLTLRLPLSSEIEKRYHRINRALARAS